MEYSIALLYTELANITKKKSDVMLEDRDNWDWKIIVQCDKIIGDIKNTIYLIENNR